MNFIRKLFYTYNTISVVEYYLDNKTKEEVSNIFLSVLLEV